MKIDKSTVLTALSITGVVATTAVTAYMSPKADRAIKARKNVITKTNIKADKLELVKTAAPYYIPTALLCFLTISTILLNHREYKKELLAMSAASAYLAANRDKIKATLEKPEVKKIIGKIFPTKEEFKHQTIEETGNGDLLCIEGYSGRIFRSSQEAVIKAQERLIEEYINPDCGYCCMNDYYQYLGIEETQFGYEYGWANTDEEYYPNEPIEFSNELIAADAPGNEFGEPIFVTEFQEYWYPMEGWMEV